MSTQPDTNELLAASRRTFLKRAIFGATAMTAVTLFARRAFLRKDPSIQLPGPGSIFEPRPQDIFRYRRQQLRSLALPGRKPKA